MSPPIRCYQDLKVWKAGMILASLCYQITRRFPHDERYGLTAQIRRAAASVPANIAEGHGRLHRGDYLRFLSAAIGSLRELETEVLLAKQLGYVANGDGNQIFQLADEVGRMLGSLTRTLRTNAPAPNP